MKFSKKKEQKEEVENPTMTAKEKSENLLNIRSYNILKVSEASKAITLATENLQHFSVVASRLELGYRIGDKDGLTIYTKNLNENYPDGRLTMSDDEYLELIKVQMERDKETIQKSLEEIKKYSKDFDKFEK